MQITFNNVVSFRGDVLPMTDNIINLGSLAKRWDNVYATNGTIQTSDTTLKTEIRPLSYGIKDLMKIKTITYKWKNDKYGVQKIGFNAQNLLKLIPEVVVDEEEVINEETGEISIQKADKLGVRYSDLIPVLTKSIQQQQKMIKELKTQLEIQKKEIELLKNK